ncbi:hypothetical protein DesyoDRAFT_3796 [Desulfosporosinus youngiae DSM 17734]|uniref:DUF2164 domain-containing protein n=2 Tax=Desulfosporosinus TaxID=79206 RepID=H5Y5Q5_9FIRM|nr:hypothetical protein DesyoDRAFT_3796 [Desulfosporosinus youngiae DSM 17734]
MKKMEIELRKEIREVLIEDLKRYFANERDEDLSNLGAELLLDYILINIGPYIYNKGIEDSYNYMSERVEDLLSLEKRFR